MPIPPYEGFFLPLLHLCKDGRENKLSNEISSLPESMGFSEAEKERLAPSEKKILLSVRIACSKTRLTKAKLLRTTKKRYFVITDCGLDLLKDTSAQIDDNYLRRYPEYVEFITGKTASSSKEQGESTA